DAWIDNPTLEETPEQLAFRKFVAQQNDLLGREGQKLRLPIADYIGISLDGYRISPSVARLRGEPVLSRMRLGGIDLELNEAAGAAIEGSR
ncbi:MAG: hypothetical protein KGQ48_13100, partial [Bradyrhizobium sp.]|nr:hypothetical protein [Bradyrhizobium sp.]